MPFRFYDTLTVFNDNVVDIVHLFLLCMVLPVLYDMPVHCMVCHTR